MSSTSSELFSPAAGLDAARILAVWAWMLRAPFRLVGVSVFGDLFLENSGGSIVMLDMIAGELKEIAICVEEFEWGLGNAAKREVWLMADLARIAAERGLQPGLGQCLAFQTPPMLGGAVAPENLVTWDLYAYYDGLAKLLPQVLDLAGGTEVRVSPK